MKALINGQIVDLAFDRATNRYHYTFTADSSTKNISIVSDCEGDTVFKDIQLEKGSQATPYVVPEVQTGVISGIFKNLKQINLEMTDQEKSELWSKIKISTQGTLEQYHRDHISTEIARTADGIWSVVNGDGAGSVNSRITQLRNLIEQRVSVEGLSGIIRNSGDNIMLAIANKGEGLKTAINLDKSAVRIKGETIHLDGAVFTEAFTSAVARIIKLSADNITTGQLDASKARIINLDANSIVGLDANFIKAKIELAIVDWMKGKVMEAQNGAMRIDLMKGGMNFYTDSPAIRRVLSGYPNQFLSFRTGAWDGKPVGVTILGSNSLGEGSNGFLYAGIRIWNSNMDNRQVDVVGNTIRLTPTGYVEAFDTSDYGWLVNTKSGSLEIKASNIRDRFSSKISVGDIWLYRRDSTYSSLIDTINLLIDNVDQLHQNKHGDPYSYTLPNKFV